MARDGVAVAVSCSANRSQGFPYSPTSMQDFH